MELGIKLVELLLLPPGVLVLGLLLGLLIQIRWHWAGGAMIGAVTMTFLALSLPQTGHRLLAGLDAYAPALPVEPPKAEKGKGPQAIVILGSGRYADAPEYGSDTVSRFELERLRYGARLQRATGLPVLLSGGSVHGEAEPEARLAREVFVKDLGGEVRWLEERSRTTWENAQYSEDLLTASGIKQIYLVTHGWHMRRAAWSFEHAGIHVTPAPLGFSTLGRGDREILGYLPSAFGLLASNVALHERLGFLWYTWRFGADAVRAADPAARPASH